MQNEEQYQSLHKELLARLNDTDDSQASDSLTQLAYRRAREVLEQALDEARTVRLQAIDDARANRERELTALMETLRSLRQAAETQIAEVLSRAEIEAERLRYQAAQEVRALTEAAAADTAAARAEAAALRAEAAARVQATQQLEADFNRLVEQMAARLGLTAKPAEGWWQRLTRPS